MVRDLSTHQLDDRMAGRICDGRGARALALSDQRPDADGPGLSRQARLNGVSLPPGQPDPTAHDVPRQTCTGAALIDRQNRQGPRLSLVSTHAYAAANARVVHAERGG